MSFEIIAKSPWHYETGVPRRRIIIREAINGGGYTVHTESDREDDSQSRLDLSDGNYFSAAIILDLSDGNYFSAAGTNFNDEGRKRALGRAWEAFDRRSRTLMGLSDPVREKLKVVMDTAHEIIATLLPPFYEDRLKVISSDKVLEKNLDDFCVATGTNFAPDQDEIDEEDDEIDDDLI